MPVSDPAPRDPLPAAPPPTAGSWTGQERRSGIDRRLTPTRPISRFLWKGSRARGRREGEDRNVYVDRYSRSDLVLAFSLLVLNVLDAALTLEYIEGDISLELNPITRFFLELGPGPFVLFKTGVVTACLLFLTVHKTFRRVRVSLLVLLALYGALLLYHLVLQVRSAGAA
jgi:hypothetical protein